MKRCTMVIKIKTAVPGPKGRRLLARHARALSPGERFVLPIFAAHGKGAALTDVDGNTFIDFTGGVSVNNLGHGNPYVISAIKNQSDKFLHTCYTEVPYEMHITVAEMLNKITPGTFKKKSALFNSGAEAVENAVKVARTATGRDAIVSFDHAFHGRTWMAMSLTAKEKFAKFGFGPFVPETYKLPYPYVYRRPDGMSEKDYVKMLLDNIEVDFFSGVVPAEEIAAVIIEPIAGEGGFIPVPNAYIQGLSRILKKNGILLISDEIQTGFCRTGKWFAIEHSGVVPDIICMAKAIANGMPLSAVTAKAALMDTMKPGGFGGTFSGNPVSCAASLATIKQLKELKADRLAVRIGRRVRESMYKIMERNMQVGDVRGLGAMNGIELVTDTKRKGFNKKLRDKVVVDAYKRGLLVLPAGLHENVIRTLPPLLIRDEVLDEGLRVLENIL